MARISGQRIRQSDFLRALEKRLRPKFITKREGEDGGQRDHHRHRSHISDFGRNSSGMQETVGLNSGLVKQCI